MSLARWPTRYFATWVYFPIVTQHDTPRHHVTELLAPAGGPDAGYAALHYGADAIYLGLSRFSARAEAENFTVDQLRDIVGYAHSREKRRRVFVTVNTVIRDREFDDVLEVLATAAQAQVDAVVVQDLGVARAVRECFPSLRLHASTQLAVHNLDGALGAADLGFNRVTLARELSLAEIERIASGCGIEVEVFVHGALCYCYSGLCLYSAMFRGVSGNRGACAYPCRDLFSTSADGAGGAFPFSMKDLALPGDIAWLRDAGVVSFKIEGRKKSALYVAAATRLYRAMLDGGMRSDERTRLEGDIRSIFSRPWTGLFVRDENNRDTVDTATVGHRGERVGSVERVVAVRGRTTRLRFRTARALERHDGIQVDLPEAGRPFGFAVDRLYCVKREGTQAVEVIEAPTGAIVEIDLPPDSPSLPEGAPVYCSSSQAVKREYRFERPKPFEFAVRDPVRFEVIVGEDTVRATGHVHVGACRVPVSADETVRGSFTPASDAAKTAAAIRQAFGKLGDTPFALGDISVLNPRDLFVPVSMLNGLRRELTRRLAEQVSDESSRQLSDCRARFVSPTIGPSRGVERWTVKTDSLAVAAALCRTSGDGLDELVLEIGSSGQSGVVEALDGLANSIGRERIRLAIPAIFRARDESRVRASIRACLDTGWRRWQVGNLGGWRMARDTSEGLDIDADWAMYVSNRVAAGALADMGMSGFAVSLDDTLENITEVVRQFPDRATVPLYQDTPLFVSQSCAYAAVQGRCTGGKGCGEPVQTVSSKGERLLLLHRDCRTIAISDVPFCLAGRIDHLRRAGARSFRLDFSYRTYAPEKVLDIVRSVRDGRTPTGTQEPRSLFARSPRR